MFNILFFHPIFSSSRNHNKTTTLHLCQTPTQQHTHLHSIWLLMCACCLPCRLVVLGNLFAQFVVVASHVHRTGTRGRTAKVARAPSTLPPLSTTIPLIVTRPKMINTWVYFGRGSLLRFLTKSLFLSLSAATREWTTKASTAAVVRNTTTLRTASTTTERRTIIMDRGRAWDRRGSWLMEEVDHPSPHCRHRATTRSPWTILRKATKFLRPNAIAIIHVELTEVCIVELEVFLR